MKTYFARIWAAILGKTLESDRPAVAITVQPPVISGGGGPTDPGKPK